MLKQCRIYIRGDVIGVGFRAWTKIQSKIFGVTGWVRNVYDRPDIFGVSGGVEALLQAEDDVLQKTVEKIKEGPAIARVDEVEVIWEDPKEIFDFFEIVK